MVFPSSKSTWYATNMSYQTVTVRFFLQARLVSIENTAHR